MAMRVKMSFQVVTDGDLINESPNHVVLWRIKAEKVREPVVLILFCFVQGLPDFHLGHADACSDGCAGDDVDWILDLGERDAL